MYSVLATSQTPALVIYLLDISASMDKRLGDQTRLQTALDALRAALYSMVFRSTKGALIQPRYRVAIYAYSSGVYDVLGGVQTIDKAANILDEKLATIESQGSTNTAKAFAIAAQILGQELPRMQNNPAPLICHLTDDRFTGPDPEPIVKAIMGMQNRDGKVLIENIYISDKLTSGQSDNVLTWQGIHDQTKLRDSYAQKLRAMSSPLPESYRTFMASDMQASIKPGARMLFPGNTPEFIRFGFQMSALTGTQTRV
jgi:hypothetical protein